MPFFRAAFKQSSMDGKGADEGPECPNCGSPMRFCKAVPRVASLPELRTYNCQQCGVTATEAEEPKSVATANLLSRVASLGSPYAQSRGGDPGGYSNHTQKRPCK